MNPHIRGFIAEKLEVSNYWGLAIAAVLGLSRWLTDSIKNGVWLRFVWPAVCTGAGCQ